MTPPILEARGLSAGYGQTTVIRDLDLTVAAGETTVLIGPNGHGKTTLLRALSGLIRPSAGEVLIAGEAMQGRPPEVIARLGVVLVPQGDGLFPEMTVEDNLLMGAFLGASWRERRSALNRVYDLFPGVRDRSDKPARTLSGGERRLTALGRALMRPSRILMIDEPSLGLAPVALDAVYRAIADLKAAETTILLVEENFTHVGGIADTVHLLEMGAIRLSGSYADLSRDARVVETYLGSA